MDIDTISYRFASTGNVWTALEIASIIQGVINLLDRGDSSDRYEASVLADERDAIVERIEACSSNHEAGEPLLDLIQLMFRCDPIGDRFIAKYG